MAIKLTPQKLKVTLAKKILFFLSLFLIVASLATHLSLKYYFIKKASLRLESAEVAIKEKTTKEGAEHAQVVSAWERKSNDFKILLDNHKFGSKFFENFEELAHPKVWFSEISLDLDKGEASLSGKTDSFQHLKQQLSFFRNSPFVKECKLSDLFLAERGGVQFDLVFILKTEVFKY